MAEVRWSPSAVRDLEAIKDHIGRDSTHYAALVVRRVLAAADRLSSFPMSGRVVPEFRQREIREVLWRNYRMVYRVRGDAVEIVTVFHGARMLPRVDPGEAG